VDEPHEEVRRRLGEVGTGMSTPALLPDARCLDEGVRQEEEVGQLGAGSGAGSETASRTTPA
jgi:hypothetical protein